MTRIRRGPKAAGTIPKDSLFPYFFNWIGEPDNQVVGIDSGVGTPAGTVRIMTYYDVREVMGYCNTPDQWLSDYTYEGIYNFIKDHPAPPPPNQAQGADGPMLGDWLDISGRFTPGGPGAFTYVRRIDSVEEMPTLTPGGYTLRLVDASNVTLTEFPITPEPVADADGWMSFAAVVPFDASARQVQLVEDASATVIAVQAISDSSPEVSGVDLPGAVAPLQGVATINWTASDANGDALTYDLLYSVDGGFTFEPLQLGLTGGSVDFDTSRLAGSMSGVFRIVATDGVNTAYADSSPIQVAVKAPEVHILTPSENQHVQYGTPLLLTGFAVDAQDGNVTADYSLEWSSQTGSLGFGPNLTVSNLPTGPNILTLTVMNSAGVSNSASVTVLVGDDLYAPPPRLDVSPAEINLQAPGEAPAPQTAQLFLVNAGGSGAIDWIASSDSPWLEVDSVGGSLPYTMTVTANPTGLFLNTTHTGNVTISAGSQTFTIPVNLQIGAGEVWAPPRSGAIIYLPMAPR